MLAALSAASTGAWRRLRETAAAAAAAAPPSSSSRSDREPESSDLLSDSALLSALAPESSAKAWASALLEPSLGFPVVTAMLAATGLPVDVAGFPVVEAEAGAEVGAEALAVAVVDLSAGLAVVEGDLLLSAGLLVELELPEGATVMVFLAGFLVALAGRLLAAGLLLDGAAVELAAGPLVGVVGVAADDAAAAAAAAVVDGDDDGFLDGAAVLDAAGLALELPPADFLPDGAAVAAALISFFSVT